MKTVIRLCLTIAGAVLLFAAVAKFTYIGDGKITKGTYRIKDFSRYPDAFIEVGEDSIQFFNIDLNEIYQEGQLKQYNEVIARKPDLALSEEEVKQASDLNAIMVQKPYYVDFQSEVDSDIKSGTFTYEYNFYQKVFFGFGIEYNSLNKSIHIAHYIQELTFEK